MRKATNNRERRRVRVRARLSGTPARPRLNVFRSNEQMYVQLIDDTTGKTLASVHSKKDASGDAGDRKAKVSVGYQLGVAIAKKAVAAKITSVVFDRAGYKYHGRVKAVAEGARDGGLSF